MKKTIIVVMIIGLIGLFACMGLSYASGKDAAKAMVKKAAAYVKYQGKEKAIAEISKPRGMFDKGELYVFAYDLQGVMVAHPKNPALIGKNLIAVPDERREVVPQGDRGKGEERRVPDGSIMCI